MSRLARTPARTQALRKVWPRIGAIRRNFAAVAASLPIGVPRKEAITGAL